MSDLPPAMVGEVQVPMQVVIQNLLQRLGQLELENAVLRAQVASPDAVMAGGAGPQANGSPVEDSA